MQLIFLWHLIEKSFTILWDKSTAYETYLRYLSFLNGIVLVDNRSLGAKDFTVKEMWQGRASCSALTQLLRSWGSLACLQLCNGTPVGRWWKFCSYWQAGQLRWSSLRWVRCSAGVCWIVGHLRRQLCCCRVLRQAFFYPAHGEHIQRG